MHVEVIHRQQQQQLRFKLNCEDFTNFGHKNGRFVGNRVLPSSGQDCNFVIKSVKFQMKFDKAT